MVRSNLVMLAAGLLALGACGGDDGGGGDFSSGVSGSKQIAQLTPAEKKTFCDNRDKFYSSKYADSVPGFCRLGAHAVLTAVGGALSAAEKEKVCTDAVAACLSDVEKDSEPEMCEFPKDCNATVAEVEACLKDSSKLFEDAASKTPSCGQIASGAKLVTSPQSPASCVNLRKKCPDDNTDQTLIFKELKNLDLD